MDLNHIEVLSKAIQLSLLPVALISGVGLFLLSLTNRLGRSIERARDVNKEIRTNPQMEVSLREQLRILYKRCKYLQTSITFSLISILFSSTMIVGMLILLLNHLMVQHVIVGFFLASVVCLIISVVFFIMDICLALNALEVVAKDHLK